MKTRLYVGAGLAFTVLWVVVLTILFAGAFGLLGVGHDTSHRYGAALMTSLSVYVSKVSLAIYRG